MDDTQSNVVEVREEFLGFVALKELDAVSIANTIHNSFAKFGVDFEKLVGQGYDGCSTMAGKVGGVQAKITATYPKIQKQPLFTALLTNSILW